MSIIVYPYFHRYFAAHVTRSMGLAEQHHALGILEASPDMVMLVMLVAFPTNTTGIARFCWVKCAFLVMVVRYHHLWVSHMN